MTTMKPAEKPADIKPDLVGRYGPIAIAAVVAATMMASPAQAHGLRAALSDDAFAMIDTLLAPHGLFRPSAEPKPLPTDPPPLCPPGFGIDPPLLSPTARVMQLLEVIGRR